MKILILKPSSLGDVIHALPVLRVLRIHYPTAEIYWWLAASLMPLLEADPDLTGIIPFERNRWRGPADWRHFVGRIREMRGHQFDLVIDLQGLARSGLFAWLANGGLTIGLDTRREGAHGFHDVSIPRSTRDTHAVDWYLELVRRLGIPTDVRFTWLPERKDISADVRRKWPVAGKRWLVVNPGARWLNKRWPAEHFANLVRDLAAEHPGLNFAVTGAKGEKDLADIICRAAPGRSLNLAGETSLPEMIEWVRLAEMMVTNDTGPMHVAAALGKRVVALFGPTEPKRTGPYGQLNGVLTQPLPCAPCMKSVCHNRPLMECLTAITPARVRLEINRKIE